MQAGWRYGYGDYVPARYYEYCAENCGSDPAQYHLQPVGVHSWGTGVEYEVQHDSSRGPKTWCAYVNGVLQFCKDNVKTPPTDVQVQSEIHTSSEVGLDTNFQSVRLKTASGLWVGQNLNNLSWDLPYMAKAYSTLDFRTFRAKQAFLPAVMK